MFRPLNTRHKIQEHFHTTFKFMPYNVYTIVSEDDQYIIQYDESDDNVYVSIHNKSSTEYDKTYVYIDADTGFITFFDNLKPYFNAVPNINGTNVTHIDNVTDKTATQFIFKDSGAICSKQDNNYYLCVTSDAKVKNEEKYYLRLAPEYIYKTAMITKWKFVLQFDCRDMYNEHLTAITNSEIKDTKDANIDTLKKLNSSYLKRANLEIEFRDDVIKGYEANWFINKFVNSGRTPSSEFIASRTFAKQTSESYVPFIGSKRLKNKSKNYL